MCDSPMEVVEMLKQRIKQTTRTDDFLFYNHVSTEEVRPPDAQHDRIIIRFVRVRSVIKHYQIILPVLDSIQYRTNTCASSRR